jgi:hypothetical protein
MCIGLVYPDDINQHLFSFDNKPWSQLLKTAVRQKNIEHVQEIICWANQYKISSIPHPAHWVRSNAWLIQNPVWDDWEQEFLSNEVSRVGGVFLDVQEQEKQQDSEVSVGRNWRESIPYLQLIMYLTKDSGISLYLT